MTNWPLTSSVVGLLRNMPDVNNLLAACSIVSFRRFVGTVFMAASVFWWLMTGALLLPVVYYNRSLEEIKMEAPTIWKEAPGSVGCRELGDLLLQ